MENKAEAQEAAQTQAALNEKNSTEKFTRAIRRTQLRALRRDSSQSDVHERETSVRRSANMQKDPNFSPQASQTPGAKTRLARKSPTERRQECLKHEREQHGSTRRVDRSNSAHTGLSRGVPGDHEAQSQVEQKTAAKK